MKFNYDKETDSLYINFIDVPGVDSYEISPDYIVDLDEKGNLIGIEVLNVKNKVDFKQIIFNQIPINDIRFINQTVL
jgi:uncharacterized protein YuzE